MHPTTLPRTLPRTHPPPRLGCYAVPVLRVPMPQVLVPARQGLLGATLDWANAIDLMRKLCALIDSLGHALPLPLQLPVSLANCMLVVAPRTICATPVRGSPHGGAAALARVPAVRRVR